MRRYGEDAEKEKEREEEERKRSSHSTSRSRRQKNQYKNQKYPFLLFSFFVVSPTIAQSQLYNIRRR
jgi:hypothetical protein